MDDTLARHTGKHIASGAIHRDPLLSTGRKPFFHFGHNWVVLSIVFSSPDWEKTFSLPVLVRLYWRPPRMNGRGRPRVKGERLLRPVERAEQCRWKKVTTKIYGGTATVQVQVFDALWYISFLARVLVPARHRVYHGIAHEAH